MTLKEADEAATLGLPVIYRGVEYERITETGYRYTPVRLPGVGGQYIEKLERRGFVQLFDKSGNSVLYADPALCTILHTQKGAKT